MHIGVCTLDLMILNSQSLKDKRQVVKSLKDQIRNRFNVSIAEVDAQNNRQKATLGVACIANNARDANKVLSNVVNFVELSRFVYMADYSMEII